jgi:hypothetical protein
MASAMPKSRIHLQVALAPEGLPSAVETAWGAWLHGTHYETVPFQFGNIQTDHYLFPEGPAGHAESLLLGTTHGNFSADFLQRNPVAGVQLSSKPSQWRPASPHPLPQSSEPDDPA